VPIKHKKPHPLAKAKTGTNKATTENNNRLQLNLARIHDEKSTIKRKRKETTNTAEKTNKIIHTKLFALFLLDKQFFV
jgi:hypothetical protein